MSYDVRGYGTSHPRVGIMGTAADVYFALASRTQRDPAYTEAILRSYIDLKLARGKTKNDVSFKVEALEQQLPQYCRQFHAIRAAYGLPPSRIFPPLRNSASTASSSSLRRTATSQPTAATRPNTGMNRVSTTSRITNRPAASPSEDLPPPPYASQDPEPESTRMLEERLAAEASTASLASPTNILPTAYSPPPGPPPAQRTPPPSNSTPQASPPTNNRRVSLMDRPSTPPIDAEDATIREQSQLEEAKRASRIAERERLEMEEAVRLSLIESTPEGPRSVAGPPLRPLAAVAEHQTAWKSNAAHLANDNDGFSTSNENTQSLPGAWEQSGLEASNLPEPVVLKPLPSAALQSNNPFLSPTERRQLEQPSPEPHSSYISELRGLSMGSPSLGPPRNPVSRQVSASSLQDTPGSSHTTYSIQGPTSPSYHKNLFEPPARPPPGKALPALPPRPGRRESMSAVAVVDGGEDPLEMLRDYDTIFLVDDSTSMAGPRWEQAREALMEFASHAAMYDENGVTIHFLNSKRVGKELKSSDDIEELFNGLQPRGATPTGLRLEALLREYMARLEKSVQSTHLSNGSNDVVKPMNLIVVTDGAFALPVIFRRNQIATNPALTRYQMLETAPTDDPESVLIACAKRLDRGEYPLSQVGVQFMQIGDDAEAREALVELDDGLSGAHGVRDMVDTVPYTGEAMTAGLIVKVLLGGVNRRLDRRRTA